jgi:predicted O-methyltransferase YrrM
VIATAPQPHHVGAGDRFIAALAASGGCTVQVRQLLFRGAQLKVRMSSKKPPNCGGTARSSPFAHRGDDIVRRQIRLLGDRSQQPHHGCHRHFNPNPVDRESRTFCSTTDDIISKYSVPSALANYSFASISGMGTRLKSMSAEMPISNATRNSSVIIAPECIRHEHLFLTLDATQDDKRFVMPYQKTYNFGGAFINQSHNRLALSRMHEDANIINIGIDGWLLLSDAMKLYELAYFCSGDIIELGTYKGLSTSILAEASHDSKREFDIVTVDLDAHHTAEAKQGMAERRTPGREHVHFFTLDAIQFVRNSAEAGRQYELAFVDHSHQYQHVYDTCVTLHRILIPGAFALFHDYNDPRNAHPNAPDYGVYQAVAAGLAEKHFDFWGIYGCCGLFRRRH